MSGFTNISMSIGGHPNAEREGTRKLSDDWHILLQFCFLGLESLNSIELNENKLY